MSSRKFLSSQYMIILELWRCSFRETLNLRFGVSKESLAESPFSCNLIFSHFLLAIHQLRAQYGCCNVYITRHNRVSAIASLEERNIDCVSTALILSYLARRRSHVHGTNGGSSTAEGDGELTKRRKKIGEQPGLLNATPWGKKTFRREEMRQID